MDFQIQEGKRGALVLIKDCGQRCHNLHRLLLGLLRLVMRFYKDRIARAKKRCSSICICFTNGIWRSMLPQI